jgi:hypothetical protein
MQIDDDWISYTQIVASELHIGEARCQHCSSLPKPCFSKSDESQRTIWNDFNFTIPLPFVFPIYIYIYIYIMHRWITVIAICIPKILCCENALNFLTCKSDHVCQTKWYCSLYIWYTLSGHILRMSYKLANFKALD